MKAFAERHRVAEMVVVADAGMLSAKNLTDLDEANPRFIVGSKVTKAPMDLTSHFRWHGDAFTDGQVIDTLTPGSLRIAPAQATAARTTPPCGPSLSGTARGIPVPGGRCGPNSAKRAARDGKTLPAAGINPGGGQGKLDTGQQRARDECKCDKENSPDLQDSTRRPVRGRVTSCGIVTLALGEPARSPP